jgi:DNA-binding transcriptional MerR regulator
MSLASIGAFARLSRLSPKALRLYDELGLLVPARVDADTGYRWYADTQLDQARLVSTLRRIGVPLTQIRDILPLEPATAAEEIRGYWAGIEAEHAAQRVTVGHLVDRLHGRKSAMYEVGVRDIHERRLLSLIRTVHEDELEQASRELFIHRLWRQWRATDRGDRRNAVHDLPRGVSGDSDGRSSGAGPSPPTRRTRSRPASPTSRSAPSPRTRRRSSGRGCPDGGSAGPRSRRKDSTGCVTAPVDRTTTPDATDTDAVNEIVDLRSNYRFGSVKIQMYLKQYDDVDIACSAVYRNLKKLGMNRLLASQRYKRHDKR